MKALAYLRGSPSAGSEGPDVVDAGRDAVTAWARASRARVVEWYQDSAGGGPDHLHKRVGLACAMAALREGEADGLVVPSLNHLASDPVLQELLLAELWSEGAGVWSAAEADDPLLDPKGPPDPARAMARQALRHLDDHRRAMARLRTAAGRARKAAKGGYAFGGPRYGYRAEAGELVEAPEEQAVIARIRALAAEGTSDQAIADLLSAEGVPGPRGPRWHRETVRRARIGPERRR